MKIWKKIIGFIVFVLVLSGISMTAFAGQWKYDTNGWWYQRDDGSYPFGKWEMINNVWYYFLNDGYMASNGQTPDGYWVDQNGAWIQDRAPVAVHKENFNAREESYGVYDNHATGTSIEIGWENNGTKQYAIIRDYYDNDVWYGEEVEWFAYNVNGYGVRFVGNLPEKNESITVTWSYVRDWRDLDLLNVVYSGNNYNYNGYYEYAFDPEP